MNRVSFDELTATDDMLYIWMGKPYTGVAFDTQKSGKVWSEITYQEGIQTGPAREWHPTGELMIEENYVNGSKHGRYREWFDSGRLKMDAEYEFSILVRLKEWDKNGLLIREFEIGEADKSFQMLQKLRNSRSS